MFSPVFISFTGLAALLLVVFVWHFVKLVKAGRGKSREAFRIVLVGFALVVLLASAVISYLNLSYFFVTRDEISPSTNVVSLNSTYYSIQKICGTALFIASTIIIIGAWSAIALLLGIDSGAIKSKYRSALLLFAAFALPIIYLLNIHVETYGIMFLAAATIGITLYFYVSRQRKLFNHDCDTLLTGNIILTLPIAVLSIVTLAQSFEIAILSSGGMALPILVMPLTSVLGTVVSFVGLAKSITVKRLLIAAVVQFAYGIALSAFFLNVLTNI
jgi:hypothetical protein